MAEVDVSSYPKPAALPVQKSPIEIAGQLGALQSQKLGIDQQKLDQANQAFGYMTRAMTSLGPNATKDQYKAVGENASKMGLVPPDMLHIWEDRVDQAPDSQTFFKQALGAFADHQQQLNLQTGTPAEATDSANNYQGKRDPITGAFTPATSLPVQVPPTQPIVGNNNAPGIVGAPPAGVRPVRQGLPVQQPGITPPAPVSASPSRLPVVSGPTGPTVDATPSTPTTFNNRFPNAVTTGAAPGVIEAQGAVGGQSGKDYATDLTRAKNYQTDLYPMNKVLEILKEEGPQAFGPGTPALNSVKSAIATWLPNVDQKTIDGVSNFEQAKKYLVQAARTAGNTGTNDQLAAAFEANPNVTMNGATIDNVVKSNIALRKMQHAQTLLFGQQNLPASEYSQWIAKNQNVLDPRAFGFDMMTPEAKTKLMDGIATKDKSGNFIAKKGKEKEFNKFEQSLSFANDAGLIEPPGRKQ
jgi:hypothetical protein